MWFHSSRTRRSVSAATYWILAGLIWFSGAPLEAQDKSAVSVRIAQPDPVSLVPGSGPSKVFLSGEGLDQVTSLAVVDAFGRDLQDLSARITGQSPRELVVVLSVNAGASPGQRSLLLVTRTEKVKTPLRLAIAAPAPPEPVAVAAGVFQATIGAPQGALRLPPPMIVSTGTLTATIATQAARLAPITPATVQAGVFQVTIGASGR
jgi:hypothetical protein